MAELLRLLTPYEVPGFTKRRYGNKAGDGGYVLLSELLTDQPILSAGIGNQISFDQEVAALGHKVFMHDHTIPGPRGTHPNFTFHKSGIAAASNVEGTMLSLADVLAKNIGGDRQDLILKMDIEGAEYPSLDAIPRSALRRFSMMSFEFHEFHQLGNPAVRAKMQPVFEKLAQDFTIFHVHANNNRPLGLVSGFTVADYYELSYVRTDLVKRKPNRTLYPMPLDPPNVGKPELPLWFFPFLPIGPASEAVHEAIVAMGVRMDAAQDVLEKQRDLHILQQRIAQLEAELAKRPVAAETKALSG
ncbi:FkbM family methyltransferase [Plastoroseomonas arctica]|uniref:Methyltransferase FkbM domain-containing protein n=1 Tax=Plastoroseomonas arctica TaxID=1509237 RepID=A0AAF1K3K1_9PROT|nr:hypothetical protein [Plastoroseomonas arctica]